MNTTSAISSRLRRPGLFDRFKRTTNEVCHKPGLGAWRTLLTVALAGCIVPACSASKPAEPATEIAPTFTLREIMQSMVGPRADSLWNAVGISVTEKGPETTAPRNDEEWVHLRYEAVTLAEAMNSILVPGRKVANPGDPIRDPKAEFTPDQIEALINQDQANYRKLARDLQDAVAVAIKAIDAKDAEGLSNAGTGLSTSCETCHKKYWYPSDAGAQK
jgi:hypothetical protein